MASKLTQGLILGGLGYVVGLSTGVAAFGSAVSGAFVFGPIGLVFGWLMAGRGREVSTVAAVTDPGPTTGAPPVTPAAKGDYQQVEDSVSEIIPIVGRIAASVWNLQMTALSAVGAMPYLVRYPWLMLGIGLLLLAIVFPLGVVFTVTGLAAMHYGARPEDSFRVLSSRPKG